MTKSTTVATVPDEAKAVITEEMAALLLADAGAGREDLSRDDFAIPFLKIAQGLSKEVIKGEAKHIPGLEVGDFFDSVNGETYKEGLHVIRVHAEKRWLEWRPLKAGGGLVAIHATKQEAEHNRTPLLGNKDTDTEIVETAQVYLLALTSGGVWAPRILSWKKTQLKEWRRWNAIAGEQSFRKLRLANSDDILPEWGVVYQLTTKMEKNSAGQPYAAPSVKAISAVLDPKLYKAAKDFREVVLAGKVKVVLESDEPEPEPTDDERANY